MVSTLSLLTISQRTLATRHSPTPQILRARELATTLIARQGSHAATLESVGFLQQHASRTLVHEGNSVAVHVSHAEFASDPPPKPYGLKGGAAREALVSPLGVRNPRAPRDIDLIRRGPTPIPSDEEMARRFMTRDYTHGARVELISDMHRYLASRDITINEIALLDQTATLSVLAALDFHGYIIRPSRYRGGSIHRKPSLDGRVLLKMARLFAEAEHYGDPAQMVGIPDAVSFSEFDLAIQLNKAFQRGATVARGFIETLVMLGALQASPDPLSDVLQELEHLRHGEKGLLSDVPQDFF
jgi:hypothetical protein